MVWLTEDGATRRVPLSSSNLVPYWRCGGRREAGSTVAESQVTLYRGGTYQIRRRRRAARSSMSQRSAEPLCTRIKDANREVSEGEKADVLPRSFFFLRGPTRSGERTIFVGLFQGCTGLWTTGCWLARPLHQFKVSTTMDLGISISLFLYDVWP